MKSGSGIARSPPTSLRPARPDGDRRGGESCRPVGIRGKAMERWPLTPPAPPIRQPSQRQSAATNLGHLQRPHRRSRPHTRGGFGAGFALPGEDRKGRP
jgi:hypothetical protein